MLFGEGPAGPRPAAHRARPPHALAPRPGLLPGRLDRPGRDRRVEAALREAQEETGLDPAGVDVFAELPELWLPPSNFAVTPVLGWWREPSARSRSSTPTRCTRSTGSRSRELLDPAHRITVTPPVAAGVGPGFLIGDDKDVILWGFTAGIIARLFDFVGWTRPCRTRRCVTCPAYMLQASSPTRPPASGTTTEIRGARR